MSRSFESSIWSMEQVQNIEVSLVSMEDKRTKLSGELDSFEVRVTETINLVLRNSDFGSKYNSTGGDALIYVHSNPHTRLMFTSEFFPTLQLPIPAKKLTGELIFHPLFEEVIERFTLDRRKPNQVLQETRSSDFCYMVTVKFEAVPESMAMNPQSHNLLREFQALKYIWESFRSELVARKCGGDQLIGFPMPFEFRNVVGSPEYDFQPTTMRLVTFYNLHGRTEKICLQPGSSVNVGPETKCVQSGLSYLSMEKVGPHLPYLMDLMQTQNRRFTLSSALKVYDQLLSRLMVLHKYAMLHGNVTPRCLSFGCNEASNVIYLHSLEKAVLCSAHSEPLPFFHDRFVSHLQSKERKCHYICDLEAAFYVFVYMLLDRFPWDKQLPSNQESSESDVLNNVADPLTRKSTTTEIKEKFWSCSDGSSWITKNMAFEFNQGLYCNFSIDLVETLYAKMKESLTVCSVMTQAAFHKELFISGSAPHNCYFGIRKVIASYFRFESLNQTMKDVTCHSKLEMLLKEDPKDRRVAWDLSYWCWNCLDTDPDKKRKG